MSSLVKYQTISSTHYALPDYGYRTLCVNGARRYKGKPVPDFMVVTCIGCLFASGSESEQLRASTHAAVKAQLECEALRDKREGK